MKLKAKDLVFFLGLFCFILSVPYSVSAVTISINQFPPTISDQEFTVDVLVAGANPATNYLRVDLFKDGTSSNYFGETFNGYNWYSGSDGTQYAPIIITADKTGQATIRARMGSPSTSDYDGTGTYKLRIRRYTASGGSVSADEANASAVQIAITVPTCTPTPSETPTPTSTPTPTRIPTPTLTIRPSLTPTHTPIPTVSKPPTPTSIYMPTITLIITSASMSSYTSTLSGVLGVGTESAHFSSRPANVAKLSLIKSDTSYNNSRFPGSKLIIVVSTVGIILLVSAILLIIRKKVMIHE